MAFKARMKVRMTGRKGCSVEQDERMVEEEMLLLLLPENTSGMY